MKLSCVILTKNEEKNIEECLKTVAFCDEIIIVDDFSEDKTLDRCEKSDVRSKIYKRAINGNFAGQRNFGLNKATGDWVLFIDPDERISDELKNEIVKVVNDSNENCVGYYFKRHDIIWGKKISQGEIGALRILRLARKNSGRWARKVHETWKVDGEKATFENCLIHYPHQNLTEFINHIEKFSSLHAQANFEEGKNVNLFKILTFPLVKFFDGYILKAGFLDGVHGFVIAILMSFHSYLSWSKLWLIKNKK